MTIKFQAKAMILAAGRGERMNPLTEQCPKPLLTINGKPLISYHLEKLSQLGFKQVVINIAWLGHLIKQELGDGSQYDLDIIYSDEGQTALETAGGIVKALPHLAEEFWVINADVFTDFELKHPQLNNSLASLILVENPSFHPQGDFGINAGYLVTDAEKSYTFSGMGFYKKQFFENLDQGKKALGPLLIQNAKKKIIQAEVYTGFWSDVGTPERLAELQSR